MSRPDWADEPIEIVEHDPAWREEAWRLIVDVRGRLEPWLVGGVHHVGSTAVRGLAAKPIIDLIAGIDDLGRAPETDGTLASAGWELVPPELDDRPWRRFYVLARDGRRHAHLQVMEPGHERWNAAILFRDRLRADDRLRDKYARLQRRAAATHRADREGYTRDKDRFVAKVLAS